MQTTSIGVAIGTEIAALALFITAVPEAKASGYDRRSGCSGADARDQVGSDYLFHLSASFFIR